MRKTELIEVLAAGFKIDRDHYLEACREARVALHECSIELDQQRAREIAVKALSELDKALGSFVNPPSQ